MSRSYKKHPFCTDGSPHTTQESKKFANKKVRNTNFEDLPVKGKGYKKVYESYDIHDWKDRMTKEEWIKAYYKHREWYGAPCDHYTLEEWIKEWDKDFRRK